MPGGRVGRLSCQGAEGTISHARGQRGHLSCQGQRGHLSCQGAEGGISHARGQRDVSSPRPTGTREARWGALPVSPSVLYPLGPHQYNQFQGVLGRGGVRWPRLTGLPKPSGDWLVLLQGRGAWGCQGDGPHSWQGRGIFPGCLGARTAQVWTAVSSRARGSWPSFLLRCWS